MSEHELEPRLAVVESQVAENGDEIRRLRERVHTVESTQAGIKYLAEQMEWLRRDMSNRESATKEREANREQSLKEFVEAKMNQLISAAFDRRDATQKTGRISWISLTFQAGGWVIALVTLILAATGHLG